MDLVVKAYLTGNDGSQEVRRFSIKSAIGFKEFSAKLKSIFPSLVNDNFQIYWNDEEGDCIVMSSSEELSQAVANQAGLMKVFIKTEGIKEVPQTRPTIREEHTFVIGLPQTRPNHREDQSYFIGACNSEPNIICDSCNKTVKEARYKCLECNDYDLCKECFAKDVHPDHDMLRIVSSSKMMPTNYWFHPLREVWQKMGRKVEKEGFKHDKLVDKLIMKQHCKRKPHHHKLGSFSAGFRAPCNREWKRSSESGHDMDAKMASREQSSELLRCIGASVANMLDPLGINVTVDVEHSDGELEQMIKDSANPLPKANKNGGSKVSFEDGATSKATPEKDNGNLQFGLFGNQKEVEKPEGKERKETGATPKKSTEKKTGDEENGPSPIEWTFIDEPGKSPSEIPEVVLNAMTEIATTNNKCGIFVKSIPNLPTKADSVDSTSGVLYPDLKADMIQQALDRMLAMGYSNEGDWLSALLKAKKGNIPDVLDVLHPNQGRD